MIVTKRRLKKILLEMKDLYNDNPVEWTGDKKTSFYYNCGCMNIVNGLAHRLKIKLK